MINSQHVTLNDTTQMVELCMSIVTKIDLVQKSHDLMDCNSLFLNKETANCCISRSLSAGRGTHKHTLAQNSPGKMLH